MLLAPACGSLMDYPDKPLPEGGRLRRSSPRPTRSISGGRQDVHLHHPQGCALLGRRAGDRPRLRARASSASSIRRCRRFWPPRSRLTSSARKTCWPARTTTLSGVSRQGQDADSEADEAQSPNSCQLGRALCAVPPSLPADPEGAKAPLSSAGALLRRRSTSRASGSCWSGTASTGASVPTTSIGSSPTSADAGTAVDRVASGTFDYACRQCELAERAAELGAALRRQQVAVLRQAREPTCACSSSTRAGRSSRTTRSCGRRSTSPSTAGRSRARDGPLGGHAPPTSTCARHSPATGTSASTRSRAPTYARRASSPKATRGRQGRPLHKRRTPRRGPGADPPAEPEGDRARARDQAVPAATVASRSWRRRASLRHRPDRLVHSAAIPRCFNDLFDGRTIGQPGNQN